MDSETKTEKKQFHLMLAIFLAVVLLLAWVVAPSAREAFEAMVTADEEKPTWGVINEQGEWVVEPQFFHTGGHYIDGRIPMSDESLPGTIASSSQPGHWGFIDREGNVTYRQVGFPGASKMKEELLKAVDAASEPQ